MREPTYAVSYVILQELEYDNATDRAARCATPIHTTAHFFLLKRYFVHYNKSIFVLGIDSLLDGGDLLWSGIVKPKDDIDYGGADRRQNLGEICSSWCHIRKALGRETDKLTTHGGAKPHGRETQKIAGRGWKRRTRENDEAEAEADDESLEFHIGCVLPVKRVCN